MSKIKWVLGGGVVVVATLAGANFDADQSLKNYYQDQKSSQDLLQMKYEHFNMGLLSGSADWTMSVLLDPCQPTHALILKGQDKIHRSLSGYRIESILHLDAAQKKDLEKLYQKPIVISTNITWLGNIKSTLKFPEMNYQQDGMTIHSTTGEIKIGSKKVQDQFKIVDFSSHLEKINLQQANLKFSAQNFRIKSNQSAINTVVLEDGYSALDVGEIQLFMGEKNSLNLHLKDLAWRTETKLQKSTVNFISQIQLSHLQAGQRNFQDMKLNFDIMDLNQKKLQNLFDRYDQLVRECQPSININEEIQKDVFALLNHGFTFKSEGNQIKSGQAIAKLNVDGRMLPAHHSNQKAFIEAMPHLFEYKMNADIDKNMLKTFKPEATAAEIDAMANELVQNMQAQRKGDRIHISMQYQQGEKKFMKEIPKN